MAVRREVPAGATVFCHLLRSQNPELVRQPLSIFTLSREGEVSLSLRSEILRFAQNDIIQERVFRKGFNSPTGICIAGSAGSAHC